MPAWMWRKPGVIYRHGGMATTYRSQPSLGYTVKEVAESLGISTAAVLRMAKTGVLPSIRVGSRYRFPIHALKAAVKVGHHLKL